MKIVQEFKEFIARGNVVDLAVGVIIGAAFGKIVNSLVNDVIMPPVGYLMHGINFDDLFFALDGNTYKNLADAKDHKAAVIGYGSFLNTIVEFLIVAACVFMLVKGVNALKRKQEAAPPPPVPPTKTETLLEEIRDVLKKK